MSEPRITLSALMDRSSEHYSWAWDTECAVPVADASASTNLTLTLEGFAEAMNLMRASVQSVAAAMEITARSWVVTTGDQTHVLEGAIVSGSSSSASWGATVKEDFEIVMRACTPSELQIMRGFLKLGLMDGRSGATCFFGVIAALRGRRYGTLNLGEMFFRPLEQYMMQIRLGDTPDTNLYAELLDQWLAAYAPELPSNAALQEPVKTYLGRVFPVVHSPGLRDYLAHVLRRITETWQEWTEPERDPSSREVFDTVSGHVTTMRLAPNGAHDSQRTDVLRDPHLARWSRVGCDAAHVWTCAAHHQSFTGFHGLSGRLVIRRF